MNWISVKERLPEEGGYVIVATDRRRVREAYFDEDDKDFMFRSGLVVDVTHWQPLPEPPEKEDGKT